MAAVAVRGGGYESPHGLGRREGDPPIGVGEGVRGWKSIAKELGHILIVCAFNYLISVLNCREAKPNVVSE